MRCTVIGVRNLDFVAEDKSNIKGLQLHITREVPTSDTSFEGKMVDKIFVRQNKDGTLAAEIPLPLMLGKEYDLYYDMLPGSRKPTLAKVVPVQK